LGKIINYSLLHRPRPFKNESLASYIFRLSKENCLEINWLYELFGMTRYSNIKHLNYIYTEATLEEISKRTKVSLNVLNSMTIHRFSFGFWDLGVIAAKAS
jgi:hypothetical protein